MTTTLYIESPKNYSFHHTAKSHGWYDLRPFVYDPDAATLTHTFRTFTGVVSVSITDDGGRLRVEATGEADQAEITRVIRHILRMDDDLTEFYEMAKAEIGLDWVVRENAGRLLRSPTVWEDLVKTICTTNCSWGLTKNMVTNLVENLGEGGGDGKRAFPTPEAMAAVSAEFYRTAIRAGYRSPYFAELAASVASGTLDPESWLDAEIPTPELKKAMKQVKGVGDYAAENLLKLLGRYDGLALDSWLRSGFYKRHSGGLACPDKTIERHYHKFGKWRGLAIWCDITERWFGTGHEDRT